MSNLTIKFDNPEGEQGQPEKIVKRSMFFFECKICHKTRRQTLKEAKAENMVCKKCLHNVANPNQAKLF